MWESAATSERTPRRRKNTQGQNVGKASVRESVREWVWLKGLSQQSVSEESARNKTGATKYKEMGTE